MKRQVKVRQAHNLRRLADGYWVCSGGIRAPGRVGCDFRSPDYPEAVNHATAHGAFPPDAPREVWA